MNTMSIIRSDQMDIFLRLREERKRLGFSQDAFAEIGGVQKRAQINYEKPLDDGGRKPDSAYFAAIASVGADVQYILTGVRSSAALAPDERLLLDKYRASSQAGKDAILGAALGQAGFTQKYAGGVGQVVESVAGDGLSFNVTMPVDKPKRSKR